MKTIYIGRLLMTVIVLISGFHSQVVSAAPTSAHGNTRFTLDFRQLRCREETDWDQGTASDEPYVLFFVTNTATGQADVLRTEVFSGVDTGETRTRLGQPRLWGLNNNAASPLPNASNIIVLAAVMENDASEAGEIVTGIRPILGANLLMYVRNGFTRATIVSNLRSDMDNAIDMMAVASGVSNPDDRIGRTQELLLTHTNLNDAAAGRAVDLSIQFRDSGEDATYIVSFRLQAVQ
jgi:hypothetical protein